MNSSSQPDYVKQKAVQDLYTDIKDIIENSEMPAERLKEVLSEKIDYAKDRVNVVNHKEFIRNLKQVKKLLMSKLESIKDLDSKELSKSLRSILSEIHNDIPEINSRYGQ